MPDEPNEPWPPPEDLVELRMHVPALAELSDAAVAALYAAWCQERYCAGWLFLHSANLMEFARWLAREGEPAVIATGWILR